MSKLEDTSIAEKLLRALASAIGGGFHPDTRASEYTPEFKQSEARAIDAILDLAHETLGERVYEIGLDELGSNYPQLTFPNGASASSLLEFFDDNPGAIDTVVEWIGTQPGLVDDVDEDKDEDSDEEEAE